MTSHLVEIRNYYLEKNKKTMFDDTLFQEFSVECVGEALDPMRENRLIRNKKFMERRLVTYRYKPENDYEEHPTTTYKFANSSGNSIHNERNYKIVGENVPRKQENEAQEDDEVIDNKEIDTEEIEKAATKKKSKN